MFFSFFPLFFSFFSFSSSSSFRHGGDGTQIVFFVETSSQTGMNIELLKILAAALASRHHFQEIGPSHISTMDLAVSIAAANECIDKTSSTLHSCFGGTELFSPKKFHLCCGMQQQVYFEFSVRRKMRRVKEEDSGGKDTPSRSTTKTKTTHQKISVFVRRRILTFLPIFEDERSWLDDEWLHPFRIGGRFDVAARVAARDGGVGQGEQQKKKRCCIS